MGHKLTMGASITITIFKYLTLSSSILGKKKKLPIFKFIVHYLCCESCILGSSEDEYDI